MGIQESVKQALFDVSVLHPVRPSGVKLWRKCPRAWLFYELQGLHGETSYSQGGTYGHWLIDPHHKEPAPPVDEIEKQRIETATAGLLDEIVLDPEALYEESFGLEYEGIVFSGTPDYLARRGKFGIIRDWKFRGEIRPGTADTRVITNDEQAIIYAWSAFKRFPELEDVECEWYWINKPAKQTPDKPRRKPFERTEVAFTRETVDAAMRGLLPDARSMMAALATLDTAHDGPANPESCAHGRAIGYNAAGPSECEHKFYCRM